MILLETITLCVIGSSVGDIVLARDVHKRRGIVVKEPHRVIPTNNAHSIRRSHTGIGAELLEHGLESLTVIEDLGECDLAAVSWCFLSSKVWRTTQGKRIVRIKDFGWLTTKGPVNGRYT